MAVPTDAPVALVWRYYAEFWNGDTAAAADELLAPTFMYYPPDAAEGLQGRTSHKGYVAWWRRAFPDQHISVLALLADGEQVATRWITCGTHHGAYAGVSPTGRRITVRGAHFFRLAEGRIQELHSVYDLLGLRRQLRAELCAPRAAVP
jgi:steroid delta-isomerase-like uncharacterized protein